MNYSIFYKTRYTPAQDWTAPLAADVLVSAFNTSERVSKVFADFRAGRKIWLVHPEYQLEAATMPRDAFTSDSIDEADFVTRFLDFANLDFSTQRVVFDCTGFMRPHLMFLLRYLVSRNIRRIEFIYSEPSQYVARENTQFATGTISQVRQVRGFAGMPKTRTDDDLLIIGAGYEHDLIGYVAEDRKTARRIQLFAFPPLQPDFYQEAILRVAKAREAVGQHEVIFAPANDPFATAAAVQEVVATERRRRGVDNLYLSPLATKAQALGFAFYWMLSESKNASSIIFPFAERYHPETSSGLSGIWHYVFEVP